MFGFGLPELIVLMIILVVPVLWIVAIVDVIKSEFTGNNKVIWILLIIFIPFLGSILYLTIGRGQRIKNRVYTTCECGASLASNVSFCSQCGSKQN